MTIKSIYAVLGQFDTHKIVPIMTSISENISVLRDDLSEEQLKDIIKSLSKVSNNSGLQIVSIILWPDDEIPKFLNTIKKELIANLSKL